MGTGAFVLKLVVLLGLELFWLYPTNAINVPGSQNLLIRPSARAAVHMHANLVRSCLPAIDLLGNAKINLVGQECKPPWWKRADRLSLRARDSILLYTFNLETRYFTESDNQRGWLFNGRVTVKPQSLAPV